MTIHITWSVDLKGQHAIGITVHFQSLTAQLIMINFESLDLYKGDSRDSQ